MNLQTKTISTRAALGFWTPQFIVAVVLLGVAVVLAWPVTAMMKLKLVKEALPLKSPLSLLDAAALSPYRVVERQVLESTIVEALGTREYLNWIVEDTSLAPDDPQRHASVLVTYYSGGREMVPHTPDVCYLGSGYQSEEADNMELTLETKLASAEVVPVRVLTFVKTAIHDRRRLSVVYTFHCNGRFAADRTGVRMLINDVTATFAYFSKVEVSFPNATREQNIEGARKLFSRLLPGLVDDHWPDFAAAEAAARAKSTPNP